MSGQKDTPPKPETMEDLPDTNSWELTALRESLRNVQFELSTLRQKLLEHERETNQISLRCAPFLSLSLSLSFASPFHPCFPALFT